MVTLRQMEYLLTVIEQQSFTKAAELLHVSQSGLSQQIRALEHAVGSPLLERLPHAVRLTAAGTAFSRDAAVALRAARQAREAVIEVVSGRTGQLELATVLSLAVGLLPPVLADWSITWPGITMTLHEFSHRRLLESQLLRGLADVGVGPRPDPWSGDIVDLGLERFVIVAAPDDPVGLYVAPYDGGPPPAAPLSRGRLPLTRLRDRRWVMLSRDNGLSELVEAHLVMGGLRHPSVILRSSQTEAAARVAATGLGVTLLPANVIPPDLAALICEPDPPLTRPLAAYARGRFGPATERFVELLVDRGGMLEHP